MWLAGGCCLDEISLEGSVNFCSGELGWGMSVDQSKVFGVVYECGDVDASCDEWAWLRGMRYVAFVVTVVVEVLCGGVSLLTSCSGRAHRQCASVSELLSTMCAMMSSAICWSAAI
eukprot:344179-Amphidinium_carterae.1